MNYDEFYKWATHDYKSVIDIQRDKSRIVETNEIFTSLDFVLFGLEKTYPEEIFNPKDGFFKVPNDIGLGFDPDKNVIKDYLIKN